MPIWVLYALLASASMAAVSVIDKSVLANWMTDIRGSFFAFSVIEMLSGIIALLWLGVPALPPVQLLVALASGAALSLSTFCYFRAIQLGEVSRLVPLASLSPLVVAAFAALVLQEIFPPIKYAGVLFIVLGALLASLKRLRGFRFGKGVGWMLLSMLLVSAGAIASKHALAQSDPWTIFAYGKIGTSFVGAPFLASGYRAFASAVRKHGRIVLSLTGLSEGLTSITTIFFLSASATGYVTLVNALVGTQPLFLLLFTALAMRHWPGIISEEQGGGLLARKIAAIALLLAGAWIVA